MKRDFESSYLANEELASTPWAPSRDPSAVRQRLPSARSMQRASTHSIMTALIVALGALTAFLMLVF